jgi:hypothetical protein
MSTGFKEAFGKKKRIKRILTSHGDELKINDENEAEREAAR